MRTIIFLGIGLTGIAATVLLVRVSGGEADARRRALAVYAAAWLVVVLVSFRGGLRAGYSVGEELPIHLLLLGGPVLAAYAASRALDAAGPGS